MNKTCLFVFFALINLGCQARQLTLQDVIALARQQSYDAMINRLSFMSQYWHYRSFRAEMLPTVTLSAKLLEFDRSMVEARNYNDGRIAYVENNSMNNSIALTIEQSIVPLGSKLTLQSDLHRLDQFSYDSKIYNSQPLRLRYSQPLWAYNSLRWQKKTEPLIYEKAKREYIESMETVSIQVVSLFFDLLAAQSAYNQSVSTMQDRQYLYQTAKKRLDLGTVTKSEVLQLELSLLNAQIEATNNAQSLQKYKFRMFSYIRIYDYDDIEIIPPYSIPIVTLNVDDVINKALNNSTLILGLQIKRMEADQQVAQAKSSKGINVCLEAEVGFYQTADNIKETYRNLKNNETVGLTLSLPIFDWGVGKGRVKMAEAEREMNRMQQQQTHASYMQELRSSVLQFNMQSSQYNNAQKAQDIAERRYDMVKRQFETGAATVTELNTAQQEAENAKGQYLRMQQGFWTEYYKLRRSTLYDWIDKKDLAVDVNTIINNHKTGHITW